MNEKNQRYHRIRKYGSFSMTEKNDFISITVDNKRILCTMLSCTSISNIFECLRYIAILCLLFTLAVLAVLIALVFSEMRIQAKTNSCLDVKAGRYCNTLQWKKRWPGRLCSFCGWAYSRRSPVKREMWWIWINYWPKKVLDLFSKND